MQLIDQYASVGYCIALFRLNDCYIAVTESKSNTIEVAFFVNNNTYSYIEKTDDILLVCGISKNQFKLDSPVCAYKLFSYAQEKVTEDNVVWKQRAESKGLNSYDPYGPGYTSLMNQMSAKHGPQHSNYNWAGVVSVIYAGLIYRFKENLNYGLSYIDYYSFSQGATLGGIAVTIAQIIGGESTLLTILAIVLGIAAYASSALDHDASVACYIGAASYYRCVHINDEGQYYACGKDYSYYGLYSPTTGNYQLKERSVSVNPSEAVFSDYETQRVLAYENYIY